MNIKIIMIPILLCIGVSNAFAQLIESNISLSNASCNSNGTASVNPTGGTPPYQYEWREGYTGAIFNTTNSVSSLSPGFYSVKITDATNESIVDTALINNTIIGITSSTAALCPLANGEATVAIYGGTAPYTYLWSNENTTNTIQNLSGNSQHTVSAKDANGCDVYFFKSGIGFSALMQTVSIGLFSNLSGPITSQPEECPMKNGALTVTPANGTAPYTFVWNTVPVQNGQTATGLSAGSYSVTITDADGCERISNGQVPLNPGSLAVSPSITPETCSNGQGQISLSISGGQAPYTVLWNDATTVLTKSNLSAGQYSVSISDINNCRIHKWYTITNNSPVYSTRDITPANCANTGGAITVNAYGGQAPYTYLWNHGPTTNEVTNLASDYYWTTITDANGCVAHSGGLVNFLNTCYETIEGKVFQDNNGNCIQDVDDLPIYNQSLYMNGNTSNYYSYSSYSSTKNTGNYDFSYSMPDQYTITKNEDLLRNSACPASGNYVLNIPTSGVHYANNNFAMVPTSLFEDVSVNSYGGIPRPGFNYGYYVTYQNIGTQLSDGFIEIEYSNLETFMSSSPAADFHDPTTRRIRFNYTTLQLGEFRHVYVSFAHPSTRLLNTTYTHTITADIEGVDPTPLNNVLTREFIVVGSYDPNDISVSPEGYLETGEIDLTYTIRFQNTGTYLAETVIIKDVLDANLELGTISDVISSHNYRINQKEGRIVEFIFDNINLPDSNSNEVESHGFVAFKIKRKENLDPGATIQNKVNIYFDYNDPIQTNTVTNTIAFPSTTIARALQQSGMVYPNPAKGFVSFNFDKPITKLQLLTSTGVLIEEKIINTISTFEMTLTHNKGLYFYKAYAEDGNMYSGKLLLE